LKKETIIVKGHIYGIDKLPEAERKKWEKFADKINHTEEKRRNKK